MDSKAAFKEMMNLASDEDASMDSIKALFKGMFGDFNPQALLSKPEVQRLLASKEMREAVAVSELPAVQLLYDQMYEHVTVEKSFKLGYNISYFFMVILPIFTLIVVGGK